MKSIDMGLNTEPDFLRVEQVRKNFGENKAGFDNWLNMMHKSEVLRDEIIDTVEKDGCCELNWSCIGVTRFNMHSIQWKDALPQYFFVLGRCKCQVFKSEDLYRRLEKAGKI